MFRRPDDEPPPPPKPPRSRSARVAWMVLFGLGGLVLARASLATVVEIHGEGMAPTIFDHESVLMVRGTWGIERGDIIVYDPTPKQPPEPELEPTRPSPRSSHGEHERGRMIDEERRPRGDLRNTAVVDVDELESQWQRVSETPERPRGYRVGRVLAGPGDAVTFAVPDVALGILVNGEPIAHKRGEPLELEHGAAKRSETVAARTAWETVGDVRYPVLDGGKPLQWTGIDVPADLGSVELVAEGYLVLADNRDAGACCDSRVLGWIAAERIRGEVVLRLPGDDATRRMQWLP